MLVSLEEDSFVLYGSWAKERRKSLRICFWKRHLYIRRRFGLEQEIRCQTVFP